MELRVGRPSVDALREAILVWSNVLRDCADWPSLVSKVEDTDVLSSQLDWIVDFTDMQGMSRLRLDTLALKQKYLQLRPDQDHTALASCMISIGLLASRLGLTDRAIESLLQAKKHFSKAKGRNLLLLQWHLACAVVFLEKGDFEKCGTFLHQAEHAHVAECDGKNDQHSFHISKYLVHAAIVTSRLAFKLGDYNRAFMYARQAVKLSSNVWERLEKKGLTAQMSRPDIKSEQIGEQNSSAGVPFWPFVQLHFHGLLHLSHLSAHAGQFQEAVCYAQQAQKLANSIESAPMTTKAEATLVELHSTGPQIEMVDKGEDKSSQTSLDHHDPGHAVAQSMCLLSQALTGTTIDFIRHILPEMVLGLPSRYKFIKLDQTTIETSRQRLVRKRAESSMACKRDDFLEQGETVDPRTRTDHQIGRQLEREATTKTSTKNKLQKLLYEAEDFMLTSATSSLKHASSVLTHGYSKTLSQLIMLCSSMPALCATNSPMQVAFYLTRPNCVAMRRQRASIAATQHLSDRVAVFSWPSSFRENSEDGHGDSTCSLNSFQHGFLDALPLCWNVICVSLSEDHSDMIVSRLRSSQMPLTLRIPLPRPEAQGNHGEKLTFDVAKAELLDIISKANASAHSKVDHLDKAAKKNWWAERTGLDQRLKNLLEKIESSWLGGFRGIFSDGHRQQELLARFSATLSSILDKYLPSRRKAAERGCEVIQLHAHIVGLFVELPRAKMSDEELCSSIFDLLHFIVDALHLHGERSAYEEIDFNGMAIDVWDSICSYHEVRVAESSRDSYHTILILDKTLHTFPWESLPCLDGQSVSRIPSVECLEKRLMRLRAEAKSPSGLVIPPYSGAYILNPSTDLTATQETFSAPFTSCLSEFDGITARAPTEAEFESFLRDKALVLYFGHGSGSQYIRGQRIKRLDHCAVTFLMGCSSSKMVECGRFEPYGVPWNYMHAGAPAVVGTLWDVTDRDIDRFAMKTFKNWGLLRSAAGKDATIRTREPHCARGPEEERVDGKAEAEEQSIAGMSMCLDEAVAEARHSCRLRYLNGAAPVIHGIPVFLGEREARGRSSSPEDLTRRDAVST